MSHLRQSDGNNSVPDTASDETSRVTCGTTAGGTIVMDFYRAWSPHGYDRAVALFEQHFYDHSHFFRTVPNFLVQFGISYSTDEALQAMAKQTIPDDPKFESMVFEPGMLSYAGSGPNSRTSQMFIALRHGGFGTELWETPFGKVVEGMAHVHAFYGGYGDMPPWGKGPIQGKIHNQGNKYMEENFPKTDKFLECTVVRRPVSAATRPARDSTVVDPHAEARRAAQRQQSPPDHKKNEDPHQKEIHDRQIRDRSTHMRKVERSRRSQTHKSGAPHPNNGKNKYDYQTDLIKGEQHHARSLHFNADANDEEGLTKLSWELLSSCLILFLGIFILWLRFVLSGPRRKKSRKAN